MANICNMPYFEYEGPRNNEDYRNIKVNEELLRRIESLERKVDDLQDRNKKLENILKHSFVSFKFNSEEVTHTTTESDAVRRMRMICGMPNRR